MKKTTAFYLLLMLSVSVFAQTLDYHLQKPQKLFVGTPFHVLVDIHATLQDSVFAPQIDTLDVFILRNTQSADEVEDNDVTTHIDMTFQTFDTGEFTFPELEFSVKNGDKINVLKTREFVLNVESVLADSSNVVQDIAAPIRFGLGFWDYALPILAILLLVLLIIWLKKFVKSHKRALEKPIIVDNRPAWQIVMEAVEKL
ncbi:MAG TPA: hypothetical protein PLD62_11510, partial [Candidatus Cloacimonadota bacterium]|nr:hypothetical protein [Candidatus Cloacimonadota bacterium]